MKKLLILSGKDGTGKTTVASSFIEFSKAKTFADCDVDAPNLHLVQNFKNQPEKSNFLGLKKAKIDPQKCTDCGICLSRCRFDAIKSINQKYEIDEFACEGCGVCEISCSNNAISMIDDVAGQLMLYKENFVFSTAKLKMGRGNSGKLVAAVKKQIDESSEILDICIIDGSPGIGCSVIASISGVDLVLVVTEPSLSGISDMKRILKTIKIFGVKALVCVNKYDTCIEKTDEIEAFCNDKNIEFVGTIPYDFHVTEAINNGKNVAQVPCLSLIHI